MYYSLPNSYDEAALILDKEKPCWFKEINISILDMAHRDKCILGQLYGDYATACQQLFATKYVSYFNACASKEEWIKQINKRIENEHSNSYSLKYSRKAIRLTKQAELHKLRAQEHMKKAKAETALANSLLKAAKLACGT